MNWPTYNCVYCDKVVPLYHAAKCKKLPQFEADLYPCEGCPEPLVCGRSRSCAQLTFFAKSISR